MNSPVAWALVFHVFGIVLWMGGLLIVTQVLAAHTKEQSPEARKALERLEIKLFNGMAHPGAAITLIAGIAVVVIQPTYIYQTWLHAKLSLVAIMIGLDFLIYWRAKGFHAGEVDLKRKECMMLHGAVSLVFLGILIMVLIKPFSP
jgi:protoporphyrinogen IX oxidase